MTVTGGSSGLDVIFINAGVAKPAALMDITPEHVKEHFDVNFNGGLFTIQKLAERKVEGRAAFGASRSNAMLCI